MSEGEAATADSVAAEGLTSNFESMPDVAPVQPDEGSPQSEVGNEPQTAPQADHLFAGDPELNKPAVTTPEVTDDSLIAGKFKTQDELIDAWKQQTDFIKNRTKDMPEDQLREMAKERGILNEAPEAYENTPQLMKDQGIEPFPEGDEAWDGFHGDLKKAGFSQSQMETMLKLGGPWVQAQIAKLGPEVDLAKEQGTLKEEWGDQYEATEAAIAKYAQNNFPSDLLYKPLAKSAAGHKLLKMLMDKQKGGTPITKTDRVQSQGGDPVVLDNAISEIMGSEGYQNPNHPDYKTVNTKVDKMMEQLGRIRAGNR